MELDLIVGIFLVEHGGWEANVCIWRATYIHVGLEIPIKGVTSSSRTKACQLAPLSLVHYLKYVVFQDQMPRTRESVRGNSIEANALT